MEPRVFYNPVDKIVAIRTVFPEDGPTAYGAMTTDRGGHYETQTSIESGNWVELDLDGIGEDS